MSNYHSSARNEKPTMSKIPYDGKLASLFHPGEANDFFTHGPIPSEAALCAEMSRLAYVTDKARLKTYLNCANYKSASFTLVETIGYDRPGMQAFVAKSDDTDQPTAVVAFRGTEGNDLKDLIADLRLRKVDLKGHGRVDKGFIDALADDVKELVSLIPAGARSLFTGHSLGGALATLAAALHSPDYLYTYGSPRVGDHAFATSIDVVKHERYADCCDWATTVPPAFMKYEHAGDLHYINRHGIVVTSLSNEEIKEDQHKATKEYLSTCWPHWNTVWLRGLADHAPINYVSAAMGLRP
jgi:hypothetical protein